MAILDLKPHIGLPPVWDNNPLAIPPPVGAWIMNEGSGDTAFDLSGNGNDLVNSAEWFGGNLLFSGQALDTGKEPAEWFPDNNFTISFSIFPTASANRMAYSADSGGGNRFYLNVVTDTNITLGLSSWNPTFTNAIVLDEWNVYSIVLSGTTGYIYWNGNILGSQAGITLDLDTDNNIQIGGQGGLFYAGLMEYFIMRNQALTPAQIAFITANPYYAWDYLQDITAIIAAQEVAAGLSIPIAMHHLRQQGIS